VTGWLLLVPPSVLLLLHAGGGITNHETALKFKVAFLFSFFFPLTGY
jgi:hypothetical protein